MHTCRRTVVIHPVNFLHIHMRVHTHYLSFSRALSSTLPFYHTYTHTHWLDMTTHCIHTTDVNTHTRTLGRPRALYMDFLRFTSRHSNPFQTSTVLRLQNEGGYGTALDRWSPLPGASNCVTLVVARRVTAADVPLESWSDVRDR